MAFTSQELDSVSAVTVAHKEQLWALACAGDWLLKSSHCNPPWHKGEELAPSLHGGEFLWFVVFDLPPVLPLREPVQHLLLPGRESAPASKHNTFCWVSAVIALSVLEYVSEPIQNRTFMDLCTMFHAKCNLTGWKIQLNDFQCYSSCTHKIGSLSRSPCQQQDRSVSMSVMFGGRSAEKEIFPDLRYRWDCLLWTSCCEMLKPGGIWEFLGDPAVCLCQPMVPPSLYCFSGEELKLLGSCQPSVRTLHVHSPCPPAVWSGNISWEQIKVTWSQTLWLRMSNTCMLRTVHSNLLAMQYALHTQGAASST